MNRVFGDNDKLSALVMTKIDADLLVLLSDVDGLYTMHPTEDGAELLTEVEGVTPGLLGYAKAGTGRGRGGMSTKIEAARIATEAGKMAVIANGRTPGDSGADMRWRERGHSVLFGAAGSEEAKR